MQLVADPSPLRVRITLLAPETKTTVIRAPVLIQKYWNLLENCDTLQLLTSGARLADNSSRSALTMLYTWRAGFRRFEPIGCRTPSRLGKCFSFERRLA